MEVAIVGAGHVGLVSGVCLAEAGHRVRVFDIDRARLELLAAGTAPFLEPGLEELLKRGASEGRFSVHANDTEALRSADVLFLCVDTPNDPDGNVDVRSLLAAVRTAASSARDGALLVNRSTAPVGTTRYIASTVTEVRGRPMGVAVNPEFLAEGSAIRDFVFPDRVVVGVTGDADAELLREVYAPILDGRLRNVPGAETPRDRDEPVPFLIMAPQTAELLKYAANAFLAVKISFINEVSSIADELGADVGEVARGLGLDRRIGPHFLRAGIGWGGSCFPKDILALRGMAESRGVSARMLRAAHEVNAEQHRWVIRKLQRHLKTLVGRRVAMLGLAFKPNTDDLRNAPSLEIASELTRLNARVRAYDPAVKAIPGTLEGTLEMVSDPYSAAEDADAAVLVTEWPQFRDLDLRRLREAMSEPLLLDGRNFLDRVEVEGAGFIYVGVGR